MLRQAEKLNKITSSLFIVALFSFFACTIHISPAHHNESTADELAHYNESQDKEVQCVDYNATTNHNKNDHLELGDLTDNLFIFHEVVFLQKVNRNSSESPPLRYKVPIFIQNNSFLI